MCQSVGAAGFAASTTTGVAAVGTGIGGLVGGLWPGGKKSNNDTSEHSHENDDNPKGDNYVINKENGSAKDGTGDKNEADEEELEDKIIAESRRLSRPLRIEEVNRISQSTGMGS